MNFTNIDLAKRLAELAERQPPQRMAADTDSP
jgi:hypothetical protein